MRVNMNDVKAFILKRKNTTYNVNSFLCGSTSVWSGGATPNKYFTFTLLEDDTYSIKAKDASNMPDDVVLPSEYEGKAVTVIPDRAFYIDVDINSTPNTVGLMKNLHIPTSITHIGVSAFDGQLALTTVKVAENSNLTSIGENAFGWCGIAPALVGNTLSFSVDLYGATKLTTIGARWFHTPKFDASLLTHIILPKGVTTIKAYAFEDCYNLNEIIIPDTVTNIEDRAFYMSTNLTIFCEAESQPSGWVSGWNYNRPVVWGYKVDEMLTFTEQADGTYSVKATDVSNLPSMVGIPLTYNGKAVTVIEDNAFKNATTVTKVVIPSGVTSIGSSAFEGCTNLTEIIIPGTVTTIGSYAFANCETLPTIIIPNQVTTMEHYVFWNCYALSIYCQASSKPEGWSSGTSYGVSVEWNPDNRPVTWGYTG